MESSKSIVFKENVLLISKFSKSNCPEAQPVDAACKSYFAYAQVNLDTSCRTLSLKFFVSLNVEISLIIFLVRIDRFRAHKRALTWGFVIVIRQWESFSDLM
jgi:hypothetical protein